MKCSYNTTKIFFVVLSILGTLALLDVKQAIPATQIVGGREGTTYSFLLPAKGGKQPYICTITKGTLPPGLSLGEKSCMIEGDLQTAGEYLFTVQVLDSLGAKTSKEIKMRVEPRLAQIAPLQIKTDLLPSAIEGIPYHISLSAEGGMPPYEWALRGELPEGMSLDKTSGKLTGTPKQPGKFKFRITARDAQGNPALAEQQVALNVVAAPASEKPKKWYHKWWVLTIAIIGVLFILFVLWAIYAIKICPRCKKRTFVPMPDRPGWRECQNCGYKHGTVAEE